MNDFTMKELIALEHAMEQMLINHPSQDGESPLLNKLQCMIDNYCEHSGEDRGDDNFCNRCKREVI